MKLRNLFESIPKWEPDPDSWWVVRRVRGQELALLPYDENLRTWANVPGSIPDGDFPSSNMVHTGRSEKIVNINQVREIDGVGDGLDVGDLVRLIPGA